MNAVEVRIQLVDVIRTFRRIRRSLFLLLLSTSGLRFSYWRFLRHVLTLTDFRIIRFAGVIPKDEESRQLLADDAYDLAISWGKPAGRIALLLVDLIVFLAIFR